MSTEAANPLVALELNRGIWNRIFSVAPLVIVGSKDASGAFDLAPKHMAMPLGLGNFFCFVCTPRHATHRNVQRHGYFTVSYPRVGEVVYSSLAAAPREVDQSKPGLRALPTIPAIKIDGVLVKGCYLFLECSLHSVSENFDGYSLIVGNIIAAAAEEEALRRQEIDEGDQIYRYPLLAYLHPNRLAEIRQSTAFPLPEGFIR